MNTENLKNIVGIRKDADIACSAVGGDVVKKENENNGG